MDPSPDQEPGSPVDRYRLLYVEDDDRLAALTARYLENQGHAVTRAADGRGGLALALRDPFDAVILDVMLPRLSGLEVCRELRRRSAVPIIMLTALGEEGDKVLGLEVGADDYLAKPFSTRELLARVRALVRRARGVVGPQADRIVVGRLVVESRDYSATLDGTPLPLTTTEFLLLRALAERAGRVLSREQLVELTKGSADEVFDRAIDASVSRLRQKLGDDPRRPRLLRTIRGVGYMLSDQPAGDEEGAP